MTSNTIQQFQDDIEKLRLKAAKEEYLAVTELKDDDKPDTISGTKKADIHKGHSAAKDRDKLVKAPNKHPAKGLDKSSTKTAPAEKLKPPDKHSTKASGNDLKSTDADVAPTPAANSSSVFHGVDGDLDQAVRLGLLANTPADFDKAKDMLAQFLTTGHGEVLVRIGARPPRDKLFAQDAIEDSEGWIGVDCTDAEVVLIRDSLRRAVDEIGGKVALLFESSGIHPRAYFLLRLPPPDISEVAEVRVAVAGNVDAGKSTTLGVLTRGSLDDGRGLARVVLFRHKHEIETGRTSSVGMEILGFDTESHPVLPHTSGSRDPDVLRREKLTWEEISARSAKIVTFIDLAGHERYLKTTLYGLSSGAPSCVVLMVGGNQGIIGMSKEHLAITLALNIPVICVITKIDMTPPNVLADTIKQVDRILKSPGCRKTPVHIESTETAITASQIFAKEKIAPIFKVSNVTGHGLDHLRTFLNLLPSSEDDREKFDTEKPLEFSVTEVWSVPYVGTVVNGIVNSGIVKAGDSVLVGPDSTGLYLATVVKSMQRKRVDVSSAEAGQTVALALKRVRRAAVRKGMIVVHKTDTPPRAIRRFEGQVLILYHNTTMQINYQAMLHCGAVRQTVRILSIDHPQGLLRTGDRATVQFEFISHPEFVKKGMKLLFREGKTKGLGVITNVL